MGTAVLYLGVKRPGYEVDHSPSSQAYAAAAVNNNNNNNNNNNMKREHVCQ